jgi:hypothetical protein
MNNLVAASCDERVVLDFGMLIASGESSVADSPSRT